MNQNEKLVRALTDEELMESSGGFIESSITKGGTVSLLYAVRPIIKPIFDAIANIIKK